jgi:hypothetical protein
LYTHSHIHTMRRRIHVSYVCVEGPCTHTLTHTHTHIHTIAHTLTHTHTPPILYVTYYTLYTPNLYHTHTHTTYFISNKLYIAHTTYFLYYTHTHHLFYILHIIRILSSQ